jgi:GAF domain-containing protein
MNDNTNSNANDLITSLAETAGQADQLGVAIDRTLQALNKRGVQILINFDEMVQILRSSLENNQRKSQFVAKELSKLQELVNTSALLTSSLELMRVLEEVIDTIVKLTGAERAYLMLKQPGTGELKVQAARNWEQETIEQTNVTFSQGIIQTAIDGGKPLITTNAQDDARFKGMHSVVSYDLRSVAVIPLMLKDEVVGVLYLDNRIEQAVFSQHDIPVLTAFANQAAIAISNARLFEKIKDDLIEAQRQVESLKIIIDQSRVDKQVAEITDSAYFQALSERARAMRKRMPD